MRWAGHVAQVKRREVCCKFESGGGNGRGYVGGVKRMGRSHC
jgi:hypothetical protein